jgi:ribosomal protein S18 acetylase RimI-like enzyme
MQIRKANLEDAFELAQVRVEAWRQTYRGLLPDAYLDSLSCSESEDIWIDRLTAGDRQGYTLVFENDNGSVGGFVVGGLDRTKNPIYHGEIYALYLLKEYQRRGIGRQLVQAMVRQLVDHDLNSMLIWVLETNPARKFYEALGGHVVSQKDLVVQNEYFLEIGYGWEDIHSLID